MTKATDMPELLAPAGDAQKLETALLYGADAVYAGTPDLSLRTQSGFTPEGLKAGIAQVHGAGKRMYLNLNLVLRNSDIEKLSAFAEFFHHARPDGAIVSDPGVFDFLRGKMPDLPLHISTQANVSSWLTAQSWQKRGATRVILAREVSCGEAAEIREKCPDLEVETFVHGAMCVSHSGRCLLSAFLASRSGNRGKCAYSCRWHYTLKLRLKDGQTRDLTVTEENRDLFEWLLEEEYRPGDLIEVAEDDRGAYLLNARDLCLMPVLADMKAFHSLKIEGRNKSAYYVAVVTRAYRLALDALKADPENFDPRPFMRELYTLQSRGYSLGFHGGHITHLSQDYETTAPVGRWLYAARIETVTPQAFLVRLKCSLKPGDVLEFLPPGRLKPVRVRLYEFEDGETGAVLETASANKPRLLRLPFDVFDREDHVESLLSVGCVARKQTRLPTEKDAALCDKIETFAVETGLPTKLPRAERGHGPGK